MTLFASWSPTATFAAGSTHCARAAKLHKVNAEVTIDFNRHHHAPCASARQRPAMLFNNLQGYNKPTAAAAASWLVARQRPPHRDDARCHRRPIRAMVKLGRTILQLDRARMVKERAVRMNVITGKDVYLRCCRAAGWERLDGGRSHHLCRVVTKAPNTNVMKSAFIAAW